MKEKKSLLEQLNEINPDYDESEWETYREEHPEKFLDTTEDDE